MAEPLTTDTAKVIVIVRMADDLHHVLTRIAISLWTVAASFVLSVGVDLWNRDWISSGFSALPVVAFGLAGRESWTRRRKYGPFVKQARATSPAPTANGAS